MSHTQVQLARAGSSEIASYTGPLGEIVVNTDDYTLHVQDGTTAGGHRRKTRPAATIAISSRRAARR